MDQLIGRLKELYVQALRIDLPPSAVGEEGLIAQLGIDSIRSLELLMWVEDEFSIMIEDQDLSPALVDSIPTLAGYITAKQDARTAAPV